MMSSVSIPILYQMDFVRGGFPGSRGRYFAELSGIGLVEGNSSLLACGPAMGLIDIQFIETTTWFPSKNDNLTVQKRHNKEDKVRLTWSNGGFLASAPIMRRKNSGARCELGTLSEIQS